MFLLAQKSPHIFCIKNPSAKKKIGKREIIMWELLTLLLYFLNYYLFRIKIIFTCRWNQSRRSEKSVNIFYVKNLNERQMFRGCFFRQTRFIQIIIIMNYDKKRGK